MGQSEQFHEQWAYLRDNARPVVPDDVFDLRAVREFQPPSKAHVKRLERVRPTVTIRSERPKPECARRRELAKAQSIGIALDKRMRPNFHAPAAPVVRPVVQADPGKAAPLTADQLKRRSQQFRAEAARIAAYGCAEFSRAWYVWKKA